MHDPGDSVVFIFPNRVECGVFICGECHAGVCYVAVDVRYLM